MICLKCCKPLASREQFYGLHPVCFMQWFNMDQLDEFDSIVRQANDSEMSLAGTANKNWNISFFQGQFRKYSASLGEHNYILKVEQEEIAELPKVEYLCNQIAEQLNIQMPKFYLIDFEGLSCFVVRNFISEIKGAATLNHIFHYVKSEQSYTCSDIIKIIFEQTQSYKSIKHFVEICLYDALIGNHDRHGRNLGFIETVHGKILAPAYDNVTALGLESGSMLKAKFSPRGKIATKDNLEPTMRDYVQEFIALGYKDIVEDFKRRIQYEKS